MFCCRRTSILRTLLPICLAVYLFGGTMLDRLVRVLILDADDTVGACGCTGSEACCGASCCRPRIPASCCGADPAPAETTDTLALLWSPIWRTPCTCGPHGHRDALTIATTSPHLAPTSIHPAPPHDTWHLRPPLPDPCRFRPTDPPDQIPKAPLFHC